MICMTRQLNYATPSHWLLNHNSIFTPKHFTKYFNWWCVRIRFRMLITIITHSFVFIEHMKTSTVNSLVLWEKNTSFRVHETDLGAKKSKPIKTFMRYFFRGLIGLILTWINILINENCNFITVYNRQVYLCPQICWYIQMNVKSWVHKTTLNINT